MPKKENTIVNTVLNFLSDATDLLPEPLETPRSWVKRASGISYRQYYSTIYQLKRRGAVEVFKKRGKEFLKLTSKGELDALLAKARMEKKQKWDGKWRLIVFDIPEEARKRRDQLRILLKKNHFMKLQASVFIGPYVLNRATIDYLKKSELIKYIRILRVDEIDDDSDLKKRFKL